MNSPTALVSFNELGVCEVRDADLLRAIGGGGLLAGDVHANAACGSNGVCGSQLNTACGNFNGACLFGVNGNCPGTNNGCSGSVSVTFDVPDPR